MTDLRPGDTIPGMTVDRLADFAPAAMPDTERAEFAAAAADTTSDLDESGDRYYDRLTARLETLILTLGDGRPVEAATWWRYRMAKRAARPGTVDDPDRIMRRAAERTDEGNP